VARRLALGFVGILLLIMQPAEILAEPFRATPAIPLGYSPNCVVEGDFNKDGKPDLAIADRNGNSIRIMLGNGEGGFSPAVSYPVSGSQDFMVAEDLNGDGNLDLVVLTSYGIGIVDVLLGNGDGTFQAAVPYAINPNDTELVVGDFNGDGKLDIMTNKSLLIGKGDGTFFPAINSPLNGITFGLAAGDFNGDGKLDIVASDTSHVFVYTQLGGPASAVFPVNSGVQIAVADLNGDGKLDFVVVSEPSGLAPDPASKLNVFLGNGNGTFQVGNVYDVSTTFSQNPAALAITDVNGDGKLDVLFANSTGNDVSVLLGNGDGTFKPAANYAVGTTPQALAFGDFDSDGKVDIFTANASTQDLSFLKGNGDGSFQAARDYVAGRGPSAVAAADLNLDGNTDLVVTNALGLGNGDFSVFLGRGDGSFAPAVHYATQMTPVAVATGNLNADNVPDVVVANSGSNSISVFLGNGDGTLQSPVNYTVGAAPRSVAIRGGNIYVACYDANNVELLLNNGDGTFQPPSVISALFTTNPTSVIATDFNLDGATDVAVVGFGLPPLFNTQLSYDLGNNVGGGAAAVGKGPVAMIASDLNGDGMPDAVVADELSNDISVLLVDPATGFLSPASFFSAGVAPVGVAAGDFDGDGKIDLAVADQGNTSTGAGAGFSLLLGNGAGSFQAPASVPSATASAIVSGDFNTDGATDVAVMQPFVARVFLNNSPTGTRQATQVAVQSSKNPSALGDSVTLNATVTTLVGAGVSQGTVAFFEGGTQLSGSIATDGSGQAGFSLSSLTAGLHQISAQYQSNSALFADSAGSISQDVQAAATLAVSSDTNPSMLAAPVTFTASFAPNFFCLPSGQVGFYDGATLLGNSAVQQTPSTVFSALTTSGLAVGSHDITAQYAGNDFCTAAVSAALVQQVVNPGNVSLVIVQPTSALEKTQFAVTVSGAQGTPSGVVTIDDGGSAIASGNLDNTGSLTLSAGLGVGRHLISAQYAGDNSYAAASSSSYTIYQSPKPH